MRTRLIAALLAMGSAARGDVYTTLLQRYESQIKQQESRMRDLRKDLLEKEQEARRWQTKAESAKTQWTQAGLAVSHARKMVRDHQERRSKVHALAEAAQWSLLEQTSLRDAAELELALWTIELYKRRQAPRYFMDSDSVSYGSGVVLAHLADLSVGARALADRAQQKEAHLRLEEMRWREEEQKQALALDRYRGQQQTIWLRWQEALRRRQSLEEERAQLEQSAQALRVMLGELRSHRDQTAASRPNTPQRAAAFNALKGTLPWPAAGTVTQNFGRHYSESLQQLVISNGIKLQAETGQSVRAVRAGKVLFAQPFQQYGQLVILQHANGLTSVYAGLGQTRVKESDVLAALDPVGAVGASRSFYFELRHEERPINPLAWLEPRRAAEASLPAGRQALAH
ncbi:MAG: hypothetical protein A2992_08010 [Elusimicrobia bacterium RIFCSPLOWO2_01_FULL_59_12]|nr:MAG: hypothetical protein A2992_08010 [Elusimicrobia bacterium RIFCSPLOWO2_01_FULL_59_12]